MFILSPAVVRCMHASVWVGDDCPNTKPGATTSLGIQRTGDKASPAPKIGRSSSYCHLHTPPPRSFHSGTARCATPVG